MYATRTALFEIPDRQPILRSPDTVLPILGSTDTAKIFRSHNAAQLMNMLRCVASMLPFQPEKAAQQCAHTLIRLCVDSVYHRMLFCIAADRGCIQIEYHDVAVMMFQCLYI